MTQRFHYLDAARTLLMAALIPYHICLAYNPYHPWGVWSPDRSPVAAAIAAAIIMVLLPGFFLVSGLFSALSLTSKEPGAWARSRLVRLGVPLVATALLLNPIQMAAVVENARFYGTPTPSLATMVTTPGDHWIRHLWFLPCLILQSLLLALVWRRVIAARERIERVAQAQTEHAFSAKLLAVAVIVGGLCLGVAAVPKVIHWDTSIGYGLINLRNTFYFLPFYVIGALLYVSPALLDAFTRPRPPIIVATVVLLVVQVYAWGGTGVSMKAVSAFCETTGGLLGTQVLLATMRRYADRPSVTVRRLSDASFTIYLFHQPIVSALAAALLYVALPPLVEIVGVVIATYMLAYAAWLVVKRSRVLLFLFNGVLPKRRARSA